MHHTNQQPENRSVLAALRDLAPQRRADPGEALQVAELQASRLRELTNTTDFAIPEAVISELPRVEVRYRRLPTSGISYWDAARRTWTIGINAREPISRQRFTLFHEFKHIIDHGRTADLYPGSQLRSVDRQAEQAADYFAGCVLMPKRLVKAAWASGIQSASALADLFEVSERAIEVRLAQIGISETSDLYLLRASLRRHGRDSAASSQIPSAA